MRESGEVFAVNCERVESECLLEGNDGCGGMDGDLKGCNCCGDEEGGEEEVDVEREMHFEVGLSGLSVEDEGKRYYILYWE